MKKLFKAYKRVLSFTVALCLLFTSMTYLLSLSSMAETTTPTDTVVYKIVSKDLNTTNKMLSGEDIISAPDIKAGKFVRMSFDYYIPTTKKGIFFARTSSVGSFTGQNWEGIVHESTTDSEYLAVGKIGRLDVEFRAREGKEPGLLDAGIGGAIGVIYIWNVKVQVKADASSPAAYHTVTGIENAEKITYGDIPFGVEDTTEFDLGATPIDPTGRTDKVMLKQENYKIRDWEGESTLLKYEKFQFPFRAAGSMKENTTYVFTCESYSDPGLWETGVNSASVIVRGYDTAGDVWTGLKDMTWQEDRKRYAATWVRTKGRGRMSVEFTTAEGQTNFFVALESGHDGVAYYWDFKLVEKDGDGTNLIADYNLYGTWQEYLDKGYFDRSIDPIMVSEQSRDGLGTYSFVPFNEEMANLEIGKILGAEEENESSGETSSEDEYEDTDETSSEETEENSGGQAGETNNNDDDNVVVKPTDKKEGSSKTVIIVVILLLVVAVLAATAFLVLKKKEFFKNLFQKILKK